MGITCWIGAKVEQEGSITLPAKTFSDLVNNLSPERVDLTLDPATQTVNLRCGGTKSNIKGIDADEFPPVPEEDGGDVMVPGKALKDMINQTVFAAATEDARPILTGVQIRLEGNVLTMIAADGYRLAIRTVELEQNFPEVIELVIPAKALTEVARIISDEDSEVFITLPGDRESVMFHMKNVNVSSQLLEGRYPDVASIIPRQYSTTTTLYTSDLLRACQRAEIFARDGESFFRDEPVVDIILDKMPVSISLGLWTTLLVYAISLPLGIRKAVRDGSRFDVWTSGVVVVGYAIPNFLFAVLLIVIFSGGRYLDWFPLRGLVSDNWELLPWWQQILDYLWHITLPVLALVVSGFATLTMLTKNSFLDEINKVYVLTARAKGLTQKRVLYGHVFRNAMLIVIAGFPGAFISILFTGAVFIEVIFSLDGLGLLGFEAAINRDYPVMFATLYFFTLLGLVMKLIEDIVYTVIDPRIDFEARRV